MLEIQNRRDTRTRRIRTGKMIQRGISRDRLRVRYTAKTMSRIIGTAINRLLNFLSDRVMVPNQNNPKTSQIRITELSSL
jgi:hypothetical protein